MAEKDFQSAFTRWMQYNVSVPAAFELKLSRGTSLPFDAVQPHQELALKKTKDRGICYKIPDGTVAQKPFDCFYLKGEAYVVIMFYKRGQKEFFMIDIDVWLREKQVSKTDPEARKSLTLARAYEIGTLCHLS